MADNFEGAQGKDRHPEGIACIFVFNRIKKITPVWITFLLLHVHLPSHGEQEQSLKNNNTSISTSNITNKG